MIVCDVLIGESDTGNGNPNKKANDKRLYNPACVSDGIYKENNRGWQISFWYVDDDVLNRNKHKRDNCKKQ